MPTLKKLLKISSARQERVQAARERQRVRFEGSDIICNSDMHVAEVRKFCKLDEAEDSLVRQVTCPHCLVLPHFM